MGFRVRQLLPWITLAVFIAFSGYQLMLQFNEGTLLYSVYTSIQSMSPKNLENCTYSEPIRVRDRNETAGPRVAICLVGGARLFEVTGRSIRRHVLDVYHNADVFVHSPLDQDSHKLTLLKGSNLAVARIFTPQPLPETNISSEVLTAWGSPHGLQGLLQYFNLVEGCWGMVRKYEVQHKIKYDWIIRTRLDGYWNAPLPPLDSFDSTHYYIPFGSDFHGLNDRFGMGSPETSWAANARLSLLPLIHKTGERGLNSEAAYKAQLDISGVPYKRMEVPFCILSTRKADWPVPEWGLLFAAMSTRGALNGVYCRPCTPVVAGAEATAVTAALHQDWDWPGPVKDLELCDCREEWDSGWPQMVNGLLQRDLQCAESVRNFTTTSMATCVQEMEDFQQLWEVWDAPSPEMICQKANKLQVPVEAPVLGPH